MVRNIIKKEKHSSWRIITFIIMVFITVVVIILLNLNSRARLIDFKYRFSSWISQVGERLYIGKDISEPTLKNDTQSIPVLVYHGIGNDDSTYSITKNDFRNQMVALKRAGFQTIDDVSFIKFMRGEISLPQKSFLLTFDDGQKSSYYGADAILDKLGFQATMFIATGKSLSNEALFSEYYLNKNEIDRMINSGRWNIGSHAVQAVSGLVDIDKEGTEGYFLSNRMWLKEEDRLETEKEYEKRVDFELTKSKEEISDITGKEDVLISYPFSDYGENSVNANDIATDIINKYVSKNYTYAFRQLFGGDKGFVGNTRSDNPYLLKRVEVRKDVSIKKLVETMESSTDLQLEPKKFDYKNFEEILARWHSVWGGGFVLKDGVLSIFVNKEKPSTLVVLDGTRNWKDYKFDVQIPNFSNNTIALYARSNEPEHSGVRCTWFNNKVSIEELNNEKVISEDRFQSNILAGGEANIAISVKNNMVGCYENGEMMAASILKYTTSVGGVAIQFGSDSSPSSNLIINSFSINESDLELNDVNSIIKFKTKSLVQDVSEKTLEGFLTKSFRLTPRYAKEESVLPSDVTLYKSETYKDITANFSHTDNSFTTSVLSSNDGTAYWKWPEIIVVGKQEYLIKASYNATAPSELMAKFTNEDGSSSWSFLKNMHESNTDKNYEFTVSVPEGVIKMQVIQVIRTKGNLTISSPQVFILKDGSFDKGMVTLTFDDGKKNFIDNAMPLLEKYKFPATVSIITSYTGFKEYMNPKDLKESFQRGIEVSVHTRNHFNFNEDHSYGKTLTQIIGAWFDLKQIGFNPTTFVYPYGNSTDDITPIIERRFIGARSILRGFNTRNTNPFILKDQLMDEHVTKAQVELWLNQAKSDRSWLILELHNINKEYNPNDSEGITIKQLAFILDSIYNSGLDVVTLNDGLLKLRQR